MADRRRTSLLVALCLALFVWHLHAVWHTAIDLPFYDEWDCWWTWQKENVPAWIMARHNEHLIVTTKLQFWLVDALTHGNLVVMQVLNFLLYGLAVAVTFGVLVRVSSTPAWVLVAFAPFFFSTLSAENHRWAFQAAFHWMILGAMPALYLLFCNKGRWWRLVAGIFCGLVGAFSLAAGFALLVALLLVFFLQRGAALGRRQTLTEAAAVLAISLPFLLLWTKGMKTSSGTPPLALPHTLVFWTTYLKLVAWGLAVQHGGVIKGGVFLTALFVPFALRLRAGWGQREWVLLAGTLGVEAALASMAAGRARFAFPIQQSRYAEVAMLQIPFFAANWSLWLREERRVARSVLVVFWCVLCVNFARHWTLRPYREMQARKLEGLQCVQNYYLHGGDALCPSLYPAPLGSRLDNARRHQTSFVRTLEKDLHEDR